MKVSILCIVNDQKIYDDFLEALKGQDFKDFELITIMNMNGEYDGARRAFNENAALAKGSYLLFMHPDIRFLDPSALGDLISYLDSERPFGVLGAAGAVPYGKDDRLIITSIVQGENAEAVPNSRVPSGAEEVQTLDECLFAVEREYFLENPFSDKAGWHLYGVEYCLEAIKKGRVNKVVPAKIWHLSDGKSLNAQYMEQLEILINEEKDDFDVLCTTVRAWKTKGAAAGAFRKYFHFKQNVKGRLVR